MSAERPRITGARVIHDGSLLTGPVPGEAGGPDPADAWVSRRLRSMRIAAEIRVPNTRYGSDTTARVAVIRLAHRLRSSNPAAPAHHAAPSTRKVVPSLIGLIPTVTTRSAQGP